MPSPQLKTRTISSACTRPRRWISKKISRRLETVHVDDGVEVGRQNPRDVADDPAAGDVRAGVHRLAEVATRSAMTVGA